MGAPFSFGEFCLGVLGPFIWRVSYGFRSEPLRCPLAPALLALCASEAGLQRELLQRLRVRL